MRVYNQIESDLELNGTAEDGLLGEERCLGLVGRELVVGV